MNDEGGNSKGISIENKIFKKLRSNFNLNYSSIKIRFGDDLNYENCNWMRSWWI